MIEPQSAPGLVFADCIELLAVFGASISADASPPCALAEACWCVALFLRRPVWAPTSPELPAESWGLWCLFLTARPLCRRARVFFQLCCEGCVRRLGLYPPHSPLPQPAVWLGPQSVSS